MGELLDASAPGQARVCVFRPSAGATAAAIAVFDNGRLVGATGDGTCFCYQALPGHHHLESKLEAGLPQLEEQDVEAVAAGLYPFVETVAMADGEHRFEPLTPAEAGTLAGNCAVRIVRAAPPGVTLPSRDPTPPVANP